MALRLFLISLVALMSLELPTHRDLTALADSSGRWMSSKATELSDFKNEVILAFTSLSRPEAAQESKPDADSLAEEIVLMRQDVAFEAAQENLVADFRAELARIDDALPVAEEARPIVAVEQPPTVTPAVESIPSDPAIEEAEPVKARVASVPSDTVDRLSNAVQLTRQALSAWASLIPSTDDSHDGNSF
jgi:hypothetical protein